MKLKEALELYPDSLLIPTNMENAIVGIVERFDMQPVVLMDKDVVISNCIRDGMSQAEAEEFYDYNILGAYYGDKTPIFLIERIDH